MRERWSRIFGRYLQVVKHPQQVGETKGFDREEHCQHGPKRKVDDVKVDLRRAFPRCKLQVQLIPLEGRTIVEEPMAKGALRKNRPGSWRRTREVEKSFSLTGASLVTVWAAEIERNP